MTTAIIKPPNSVVVQCSTSVRVNERLDELRSLGDAQTNVAHRRSSQPPIVSQIYAKTTTTTRWLLLRPLLLLDCRQLLQHCEWAHERATRVSRIRSLTGELGQLGCSDRSRELTRVERALSARVEALETRAGELERVHLACHECMSAIEACERDLDAISSSSSSSTLPLTRIPALIGHYETLLNEHRALTESVSSERTLEQSEFGQQVVALNCP